MSEAVEAKETIDITVLAEKLLEDPVLLRILEIMVNRREIKPIIHLEKGIEYPELKNFPEWSEKIEKLIDLKFVEREIVDRVIECPKCGSIHVGTRYKCPSCSSINMVRTSIIQHITCGYVDTEIRFKRVFEKGKEMLVCPNCGIRLRELDVDYRILGEIFECLDCGRRADRPKIEFICRNCDTTFDILTANYKPVYMFKITEKGIEHITSGDLVRKLMFVALRKAGFETETNVELKGISGVNHRFDIVIKSSGTPIISIDYRPSSGDETQVTDLLAHIAKYMDFPGIQYVYVSNKISENVIRVASSQGINLVHGGSIEEIINNVLNVVRNIASKIRSKKS